MNPTIELRTMKILKSIINNIFFKNLGLAALILILLITCVLWWLSSYTLHGEAVIVPDVKGLQMESAIPFLKKAQLRYEVVDSMHVKNAQPGSIVDLIPRPGSKVKLNRIIFITINSSSTETFSMPEVKDLSQRQALAILKAAGFENINIELIPSLHKDLVMGIEFKGREIK